MAACPHVGLTAPRLTAGECSRPSLGLVEAFCIADQPCTSVQVYAADCADAVLLELRKHLPKYYGVWSPPSAPNGNPFSVHLVRACVRGSVHKLGF